MCIVEYVLEYLIDERGLEIYNLIILVISLIFMLVRISLCGSTGC